MLQRDDTSTKNFNVRWQHRACRLHYVAWRFWCHDKPDSTRTSWAFFLKTEMADPTEEVVDKVETSKNIRSLHGS